MYGPESHSSLVHMHMYQGAKLLYGNIRTLQKADVWRYWWGYNMEVLQCKSFPHFHWNQNGISVTFIDWKRPEQVAGYTFSVNELEMGFFLFAEEVTIGIIIKENLALPFPTRMQYLLYNNWWQNILYLHNSSLSFYIAVYSLLDDLWQCLS